MASVEESGNIVIHLSDTAESIPKEVFRFGTALVSQATKTPAGANNQALPLMNGTPFKGKRIIVYFISDATDIIESEESALTLPINIVNEKTLAVESSKDLTLSGMTGFTPAGTVDITCTADVPARVCYYDAPQGKLITLGGGRKYHAYIGDDTV
jgi:hypothetical protein